MPAHLITGPRSLIIDHIGTKVRVKPRRIAAHLLGQLIHGGRIEAAMDLIQTSKVVLNPPEPIFTRAKIVIGASRAARGSSRR